MITRSIVLASLFMAGVASGGILTLPAKVAAKVAEHSADNVVGHVVTHSADNVAEHVVTHNADDAAKVLAKGGARAGVEVAPKVARAVDAAVEAARIETRAVRPVIKVAPRAPIVKPGHILAVGGGIAGVTAAHNLTAGERDLDDATADALRNNPSLALRRVVDGGRWKNILAWFGGVGVLLAFLGLALRIAGPVRLPRRENQAKDRAGNPSTLSGIR